MLLNLKNIKTLVEYVKMAIKQLVISPDSRLKQISEPFDFNNPQVDAEELANDLMETMLANNGVGLSAIQIGIPYRVIALGNPSTGEATCIFNPSIVDATYNNFVLGEEGCLSFPDLYVKVKRYKEIRVRVTNSKGEIATNKYDKLMARVIQHEVDHLDGITYLDKANKFYVEQAKRKKRKIQKRRGMMI